MHVSPKVAHAIQRRRASVGNDSHLRIIKSLPCRPTRIELQPGSPQLQMVRLSGPSYPIDAMRHALNESRLGEACDRTPTDSRIIGLPKGNQTPLALRYVANTLKRSHLQSMS
jgi:hypothetical protein